jgi:hypothetical protein
MHNLRDKKNEDFKVSVRGVIWKTNLRDRRDEDFKVSVGELIGNAT